MSSLPTVSRQTGVEGPARGDRFVYQGFDIDAGTGTVSCRYSTDTDDFTEVFTFSPDGGWDRPEVRAAARILFLAAGVSYYKTTAARVVDLGPVGMSEVEERFLRAYYFHGLGEYAFKNRLDLGDIEFNGDLRTPPPSRYQSASRRPLIPFGGGIDSIVTTELMAPYSTDAALFIANRQNDRFSAIEAPAAVTGLPIVRAERELDPKVLAPTSKTGYLNGHIPVTGVLSAAAVLAAVLGGRDAVVMSNEWSASSPTVILDGTPVNHQWSKSAEFEILFRELVSESLGDGLQYFSRLRSFSELKIAEIFSSLERYHHTFRSCNRAFALKPQNRYEKWCGECDKCCFIDLILAPFIEPDALRQVFSGTEPLDRVELLDRFRTLVGTMPDSKPFECVGDQRECIAAVKLAVNDPRRKGQRVLEAIDNELGEPAAGVDELLRPIGRNFVPDIYATAIDVV
ncbi:hypothetical protein [Pseudofrankia sp. BMG5.36]|uniref:hypothetical protein n=1 Tax=Pseudofrankia sp. BMG5.36 TaxID=1834512 RepID=UPI0010420B28|nr:hypothetical protein [Pseudofrankia sp. BMG5.36]